MARIFVFLVFFCAIPGATAAQIDVWPQPLEAVEVYRVPLWLPKFQCGNAELLSSTQTLEQIVYSDLEFSGLFERWELYAPVKSRWRSEWTNQISALKFRVR